VGRGENRRDAGFYFAIGSIAAGEPLKKAQNKPRSPVFQLSGRARSQHIPQYQTEVECADVDQQPLQNILSSAQGAASHSARLVAVGKAAFDELAASSQQLFAVVARHSALVGLNRLLLALLAFPVALAACFLAGI